jgi:hypothetical protein
MKLGAAVLLAAISVRCPIVVPGPLPPGPGPSPTSTPEPTATAAPSLEPTVAPPAPTPGSCPCVVVWSGSLFFCVDSDHQKVSGPQEGGWCTIDTVQSFERTPGDGRGQPCDTPDKIESVCKGRTCESLDGPEFTMKIPDGVRSVRDGFQLRIGPLARGKYKVDIDMPSGTVDPFGKPVERCPQYPGNNRPRTVEFSVE